ncbi:MAG: hypothetical protein D3906_16210 [Candidatus Electrothrix sp. AUS1_2]|nr:hypothetical protein [Candidatus Electrothrix sp. AUS1_2]
MGTDCSNRKTSYWSSAAVLIYIIINIRVEAGFATLLERILDHSVAVYLFLFMLSIGAKFFNLIEGRHNMLLSVSCCQDESCCSARRQV